MAEYDSAQCRELRRKFERMQELENNSRNAVVEARREVLSLSVVIDALKRRRFKLEAIVHGSSAAGRIGRIAGSVVEALIAATAQNRLDNVLSELDHAMSDQAYERELAERSARKEMNAQEYKDKIRDIGDSIGCLTQF